MFDDPKLTILAMFPCVNKLEELPKHVAPLHTICGMPPLQIFLVTKPRKKYRGLDKLISHVFIDMGCESRGVKI